MTVCFFGVYNHNYSRNIVLNRGLAENNCTVIHCNTQAKGLIKYVQLIKNHHRLKNKYDVLLVAFPGYQIMPLAKLLTKKPLIFDAFNSIYDSTVIDRERVRKHSIKAYYYWILNWLACSLADRVLLDTNEHINYFVNEFHLKRDKFARIFIGADDKVFYPRTDANQENANFLVHFHGSFIPLQGVEFILQAAKILENERIRFNIIGSGQTLKKMKNLADELELKNVNFPGFTATEVIAQYQKKADVCLGIFGKTPKASRVIPNKVYEAMATGKAVITGESPAAKELLKDKENVLFCRLADAQDLADKILFLKNNQKLCHQLAENGYYLYQHQLTPLLIGRQLVREINEFLCN